MADKLKHFFASFVLTSLSGGAARAAGLDHDESLIVGVSFGISGAIFQSLARNPLASPDIIGIDAGASAAAVFCIVVLGTTSAVTAFFFTVSQAQSGTRKSRWLG